LDKVKSLESRIGDEMTNAQGKASSMQDDMDNKFTKTDTLKRDFEREKIRMMKIKKFI